MPDANAYIDQTRNGLIAAVQGLSEVQWTFQPAPECWSIAQILEHIVVTQEVVLDSLLPRLAGAPPAPANHNPDVVDALIVTRFAERSRKFQGPKAVLPAGRWTPAECLSRLDANCVRLHQYLEATPGLREHAVESLPLKAISDGAYQFMDGYQWMLAMAAHTQRHTLQILEVKADANFPAAEANRASAA
ncbi:MAG TPA: DinB family protein [Bryobacteraceae bacterium]|nr:DinB family protein [Bryobacteraceae bacterium]